MSVLIVFFLLFILISYKGVYDFKFSDYLIKYLV